MTQPRVAIITGAFGALGSTLARSAAQQGFRVALIDRTTERRTQAWEGAEPLILGGVDLASATEAQKARDAIVERYGAVDVLFNVAGAFKWETIEDGEPDTLEQMFRANVQTTFNCSRAVTADLKRSAAGRIANVGAYAALSATAGMGPYAASKAAVHQLTHAMACELGASGVTVNAVLPSIIDTPANRAAMPDADTSTWVPTHTLAAAMLLLASESAHVVSGALIPVTLAR